MLRSTLAAAALLCLAGLPAEAAPPDHTPAPAPFRKMSQLVKLPDFVPGMGTLYVDPSTLPAGPCWALGCGVGLYLAGNAAFRHALRIGTQRYRLAAAAVAVAASVVGVTLSVAAEIALLTVIVAAALALERRAAAPATVDA